MQLDANDAPGTVLPTNLATNSDQIIHQINVKPVRDGECITYRIGYMQTLIPSNGDATLEGLSQLAHIPVSGNLEINTTTLTFQLQQTLRMKLIMDMPFAKQEDLHIQLRMHMTNKNLRSRAKGSTRPHHLNRTRES